MPPLVTWFRNDHEHSLHYVKFGLMQMARDGEIRFGERSNADSGDLLPATVQAHAHRRTAALRIDGGGERRLIILDGEDSLFQTSPLIEHCDLYFSCTDRKKFFEGEAFDLELPWQTECELEPYRENYSRLQQRFRAHLSKARPLVPIGPAMEMEEEVGLVQRKLGALRHRLSVLKAPWLDWPVQYGRFQRRWAYLQRLRRSEPCYDVVLKDSLWGWPRHRVALHRELRSMSDRFDIRSELHFREASPFELGTHPAPQPGDFPLVSGGGVVGNYEEMLAQSRLGMFATGFHYGCRNITTLAWFLGLRTLSDPASFEAIYDFTAVGDVSHLSGNWSELEPQLERARSEKLGERQQRQARFDELASPRRAARVMLEEAFS